MNSNHKKDKSIENLPKVEESSTMYKSKIDLEKENPDMDWDNLPEILQQLLEKGIKQCEEGQTKPHAQVMAEMKARFNLKN
ncbi:hypothetical protein MCETHM1_03253 [Flavobacteriaceae bacterium]|jgi:hypothetical protein